MFSETPEWLKNTYKTFSFGATWIYGCVLFNYTETSIEASKKHIPLLRKYTFLKCVSAFTSIS